MSEPIRKLSVLNSLYRDGLHIKVGSEFAGGTVCKIIFREDIYVRNKERVYDVQLEVRDNDNPEYGERKVWKQIGIGDNDTWVVENDIKSF